MPGAGYDISASLSSSASSATGAIRTGNVSIVNGGKKTPLPWYAVVLAVVLPFGFVLLGVWIWINRKKRG